MSVFPYPDLDAEEERIYELLSINLTRMLLHTHGLTLPEISVAPLCQCAVQKFG